MESNEIIAPFVMKTYQMVNDSSLDNLIRWGTSNNSFIVVDSLDFSQRLLPAYFKHNNFSSFIRQLNTYGFRKVDPDRWEFANEWFLKGQVHLLKNIGRKRQLNSRPKYSANNTQEDEEDEEEMVMAMEIARLKEEQKALEQELVVMNKRLEATERRPEQMMALLCKVAEDPGILNRMMLEKVNRSQRSTDKKKQRRLIAEPPLVPSSSSSSSVKREDNDCYEMIYGGVVPSPDGSCGNPTSSWSSPLSAVWMWNNDGDDGAGYAMESEQVNGVGWYGNDGGGGGAKYFHTGSPDPTPPYPFSLLGGGF